MIDISRTSSQETLFSEEYKDDQSKQLLINSSSHPEEVKLLDLQFKTHRMVITFIIFYISFSSGICYSQGLSAGNLHKN